MWPNKAVFASALILASLIGAPAQAAYVVTLGQAGPNVVADGSGTIDLAGLSLLDTEDGVQSQIIPDLPAIVLGGQASVAFYGDVAQPANFGSGDLTLADAASGQIVGADRFGIVVPEGYVSGDELRSVSMWDDTTLASLGVTPGVYKWTWGSGAAADSFALDVEGFAVGAAAPERSTWAMTVLGFVGLGFAGYRALRRTAAA